METDFDENGFPDADECVDLCQKYELQERGGDPQNTPRCRGSGEGRRRFGSLNKSRTARWKLSVVALAVLFTIGLGIFLTVHFSAGRDRLPDVVTGPLSANMVSPPLSGTETTANPSPQRTDTSADQSAVPSTAAPPDPPSAIPPNPPTRASIYPPTSPLRESPSSPLTTVPPRGCVFNSCQNNGTCHPVDRWGFRCECPPGFSGKWCEILTEGVFVGASRAVEIISPGYPDNYPSDVSSVIWIIQTEEDRKISVDFGDISAYYDTWSAGDGDNSSESTFFLGRIRTSRRLPDLLSNGPTMWVSAKLSTYKRTREGFAFSVTSVQSTATLTCSVGEADCGHSVCINMDWWCDRLSDCVDGRDEVACGCDSISCLNGGTCNSSAHMNKCVKFEHFKSFSIPVPCECSPGFEGRFCQEAHFACDAPPCTFVESERCDGFFDCPNGYDEKGCECSVDEYQCSNSICVSPADVECNGVAECIDFSDEGTACNDAYCVAIENGTCATILPYNATYFPNDFVVSYRQANDLIDEFLPRFTTNCTASERHALCMSFFPPCPRFGSDPRVCASLCSRAFECVGAEAPSTALPCDVYPDHGVLSTSQGCLYDQEDVLQTGDCGLGAAASPSNVVGAPTNISNWPWIGSFRKDREIHRCAATLISPQWAVTAAGCGDLDHLVFGSTTLDAPYDYPHVYRIARFFTHPRYRQYKNDNDIALLKLDSPVPYSDAIRPACLETQDNEIDIYHTCYVVGWGGSSFGRVSPVFAETPVALISLEQCRSNDKVREKLSVSSNQICTGANATCSSSSGDRGGPLVCRGTNGRWKMVGIASTSFGCDDIYPAVFTRVSKYIDFIRYTIASAPELIPINIGVNGSTTVVSPSYPNDYGNNLDIRWVIQTVADYRIIVKFNRFDLFGCCDYLKAGDGVDSGNSSTTFFEGSGTSLRPNYLLSAGNAMWLRFTSDESYASSGFSLQAQSIPFNCDRRCWRY